MENYRAALIFTSTNFHIPKMTRNQLCASSKEICAMNRERDYQSLATSHMKPFVQILRMCAVLPLSHKWTARWQTDARGCGLSVPSLTGSRRLRTGLRPARRWPSAGARPTAGLFRRRNDNHRSNSFLARNFTAACRSSRKPAAAFLLSGALGVIRT